MKTYFTIPELTYSSTAIRYRIDNRPTPEITDHLNEMIDILNPMRERWGKPIIISSGYRCPELNRKVGGSKTSAHLVGYAVDMQPKDMRYFDGFVRFVTDYLTENQIGFDQLLIEKSKSARWLHLGIYNQSHQQRRQIKTLCVS